MKHDEILSGFQRLEEVMGWLRTYTLEEIATLKQEMDYVYEFGRLPENPVILQSAELVNDTWLFVHKPKEAKQ